MDWNECYKIGSTPWEKGNATPVLAELHECCEEVFQGKVLVPGCGLGHDVRRLAELGMEAVGVDVSSLAVEQAREWDENTSAVFMEGDVFALPHQWKGSFDVVWEHTCFCALSPEKRGDYVASMVSMLKPSGYVVGVFFINPQMDEGETGPPFGIEEKELRELWESAGMQWLKSWVPASGFEGRIGRELAVVMRVATK